MRISRFVILASMCASVSAAAYAPDPTPQYSVSELQGAFDTPDADKTAAPNRRGQPRVSDTRSFSLAKPNGAASANAATAGPTRASAKTVKSAPRTKDLLITFANGSSELTAQAKANARVVAEALTTGKLANARFAIDGHTNAVGNREYNLQLSEARAKALADVLAGYGVDRSRLEVHGYGFDRLIDKRAPASGANRRVEARLLK